MVQLVGSQIKKMCVDAADQAKNFIKVPSYNTVKNWILKLGIYKLSRKKAQGNDWAFLIDKTIQMGPIQMT